MNRRRGTGWIVVGLGGDHNDRAVLDVALRQAAQSGSSLCVVRTLGVSDPRTAEEACGADGPRPAATVRSHRTAAILGQVRREVERAASAVAPTVTIECQVVPGDPATALLTAGCEADLIILSTRCDGATPALMLGQVSQDVAVHSRCPILLVPPLTGGGRAGPDSGPLTA